MNLTHLAAIVVFAALTALASGCDDSDFIECDQDDCSADCRLAGRGSGICDGEGNCVCDRD